MEKNLKKGEVVDGSDIKELVENKQVYSKYIDHKFKELDKDCDGKLSVKELEPAVADIGAALGLPPQGTSNQDDHIYSEVLNEFTHGTQIEVSKSGFKSVLSDILLGMAAGLKRDPVVILRIDGKDLLEFLNSPKFEPEILSIFSEIELPDVSLQQHIINAFGKLTVDQGMPPASDPFIITNFIEPALRSCGGGGGGDSQYPVSQEAFLIEFKRVGESVAHYLEEQPAIVAHSDNVFDGNGIKRLLSNKFELDKTLDSAVKSVPVDRNRKFSKEHLRVALDIIAPSADLPPIGAIPQMDDITNETFKMLDIDDGKMVKEEEFKKLLREVLGGIMLQLQGNPVSVSINSVVHEPVSSSSTLLQPSSS